MKKSIKNNNLCDVKFDSAREILLSHVSNKANYREDQYKVFNGVTLSEKNFSTQNQRRSYFKECQFNNVKFSDSGFSGSKFYFCDFIDCEMNFAIMDSCEFKSCNFKYSTPKKILGASFCDSSFFDTAFFNCYFQSSSFTAAYFYKTTIINSQINGVIWENAIFESTTFENVLLDNLNFEFSHFKDVHFINTTLPFATIPFIFEGLEYLLTTTDSIKIETINLNHHDNTMSKEEYIQLLPLLITFYSNTNNYFPLANILIATNNRDKAFNVIRTGVQFCIKIRDFRLLSYFSKLMNLHDFSIIQKKVIYNEIMQLVAISDLNKYERNLFNKNINNIRDNLINQRIDSYINIDLNTNILSDEYNKLLTLIESINNLTDIFKSDSTFYLELRHNSPYDIFITFFSQNIPTIIEFISLALVAFKGYAYYKETILKLKNLDLQNQKLQLDIKEKECQNISEASNINEKLTVNNIIINQINYNIHDEHNTIL